MPKPIQIEADNKSAALDLLDQICSQPQYEQMGYLRKNLANESVQRLIDGVSSKSIHGKVYVWSDASGWIPK